MAYVGAGQNTYSVFPLENYTFGHKAPKLEKQRTLEARFRHLQERCAPPPHGMPVKPCPGRAPNRQLARRYAEEGMRRTVDGVVLVHARRALHVLLLQAGPSFFRLPGGRLKAGEDEVVGMQRKLTRTLAPERAGELAMRWQVADCVGRFYRPNFEPSLYPYCPPHIERPKECKKLFLINLPPRAFLAVRLPPNRRACRACRAAPPPERTAPADSAKHEARGGAPLRAARACRQVRTCDCCAAPAALPPPLHPRRARHYRSGCQAGARRA